MRNHKCLISKNLVSDKHSRVFAYSVQGESFNVRYKYIRSHVKDRLCYKANSKVNDMFTPSYKDRNDDEQKEYVSDDTDCLY